MLRKFVCLFATVAMFIGCGDDSSSNSPSAPGTPDSGDTIDKGDKDSNDSGPCGVKKSDDVWSYTYSTWHITDKYIWLDESTARHETWMNDYHMDEDDELLNNLDRDYLYDAVLQLCNEMTAE